MLRRYASRGTSPKTAEIGFPPKRPPYAANNGKVRRQVGIRAVHGGAISGGIALETRRMRIRIMKLKGRGVAEMQTFPFQYHAHLKALRRRGALQAGKDAKQRQLFIRRGRGLRHDKEIDIACFPTEAAEGQGAVQIHAYQISPQDCPILRNDFLQQRIRLPPVLRFQDVTASLWQTALDRYCSRVMSTSSRPFAS